MKSVIIPLYPMKSARIPLYPMKSVTIPLYPMIFPLQSTIRMRLTKAAKARPSRARRCGQPKFRSIPSAPRVSSAELRAVGKPRLRREVLGFTDLNGLTFHGKILTGNLSDFPMKIIGFLSVIFP